MPTENKAVMSWCTKCKQRVLQANIASGHIALCVDCKSRYLEKRAKAARDRYQSDLEYRELKKRQSREYQHQRYSSDAVYRKHQNAKSRKYYHQQRQVDTAQPPEERASTISASEVNQILDRSLSQIGDLRQTLDGVFCPPPSSSSLRLV